MRLKVLALTIGSILVLAAPSIAGAPPVVAKALAVGTMSATTVHAGAGAMALESITIRPGGSFGWHTHPTPVAVIVTAGRLTVLDPTIGKCQPFTVSKGQAFIEPANHVHLARNDGKTNVTVYALYLGVGKGANANASTAAPAGCPS
jgi:quercetin dioxygenase-like cupin family protein